jgi:hypothetical protein
MFYIGVTWMSLYFPFIVVFAFPVFILLIYLFLCFLLLLFLLFSTFFFILFSFLAQPSFWCCCVAVFRYSFALLSVRVVQFNLSCFDLFQVRVVQFNLSSL